MNTAYRTYIPSQIRVILYTLMPGIPTTFRYIFVILIGISLLDLKSVVHLAKCYCSVLTVKKNLFLNQQSRLQNDVTLIITKKINFMTKIKWHN